MSRSPVLLLSAAALGAALLAPAPAQEAAERGATLVAVLESGRRVQAEPGVEAGARRFATPYGVFDALHDPVAAVADVGDEAAMLELVRASDFGAWLARVSERGLLDALVAGTHEALEKDPEGDHQVLLRTLEEWGAQLDPVPERAPREKRVAWLWEQLRRADRVRGALLAGRLAAEIPGPSAGNDFRLGLVDLRRAVRGKNPVLQRAAALVAAKQFERDMRYPLVQASLLAAPGDVRGASADALMSLDQPTAMGSWMLAYLRSSREDVRLAAVEHLGSHGSAETVDFLVGTLAAQAASAGYRPPGSTISVVRQISLVTDFDIEVAQAAAIADPVVTVVQEGAALEARVISTTLYRGVARSLRRLTGADPGTNSSDWVRWWEESREDG